MGTGNVGNGYLYYWEWVPMIRLSTWNIFPVAEVPLTRSGAEANQCLYEYTAPHPDPDFTSTSTSTSTLAIIGLLLQGLSVGIGC